MSENLYPNITKSFETTILQKIGDYPYPISPFAGVVKPIKPELISEVIQAASKEKIFTKADLIITFESAGAQLAVMLGHALNLPYLIARKKRFNLPNEISFNVATNFDEKNFYIYGDVINKKILIVDDVVASGNTVRNAILALRNSGAEVLALFAVAAKTNFVGKRYQDVLAEIAVPLISIVQIKVVDDKVIVF